MSRDRSVNINQSLLRRRGVLLLVVLSMLSLFMMLGIAYVVVASRARDASRGFARVMAPSLGSRIPVEQLLDSAAMLIVRGNSVVNPGPPLPLTGGFPLQLESLLEDQYGSDTLTGEVIAPFQSFSPLCSVSIQVTQGTAPTSPVGLTGRIISFLTAAGKASSHRILRAEAGQAGGAFTVWIANVANVFGKVSKANGQAPAAATYNFPPVKTKLVINGRQHAGGPKNEAWDGIDSANPFLAQVEPVPGTPSTSNVVRVSMMNASGANILAAGDVDGDFIADQCDNDNDGVIDGQFFDPGFPKLTAANGNTILTHMSCLVVDLDGRLNANVHGGIAQAMYDSGHNGWPAGPTWGPLPLGSGYGPAEISGTSAIAGLNGGAPPANDSPWTAAIFGAAPQIQYSASGKQAPGAGYRLLPLCLPPLEGRYAGTANSSMPLSANQTMAMVQALPGVNLVNDVASTFNEKQFAVVQQQFPGVPLPIDLHGRMKSFAAAATPPAVVPTMRFVKPDNSDEYVDDPYELMLTQANRGGIQADPQTMGQAVGLAPDNTFSVAELERLLRPYDSDAMSLPQRLFALLGSQAEIGRLAFTTESWDVPVIAGAAADKLYGPSEWLSKVSPTDLYSTTGPTLPTSNIIPDGVVPADIAAGLRLDVARPLATDVQRRALFKDLYLTCVALLTPAGSDPTPTDAKKYAQWAANVVEYQDPDSKMTQYEYDEQPFQAGWDVDGDLATANEPTREVVWGAERPEIVITQTLAWENGGNGELYVMLHRPWDSRLEVANQTTTAAEPSDPALRAGATAPDDSIDLSKVTPARDPVWQLRIGTAAGAPILRFDQLPAGSPDLGSMSPPPQFVSQFRANSWLCVKPSAPSSEGIVVPPNGPKVFSVSNGILKPPLPGAPSRVIRLERLADPSKDHHPTDNPYLIIDAAELDVADRASQPPQQHRVSTRDAGWKQQFNSVGAQQLSTAWGGNPAWLMWPNRPLVSIVELMHVPGFATTGFPFTPQPANAAQRPDEGMLSKKYAPPSALAYLPSPLLLETLRVPSRFAGTRLTIGNTAQNNSFLPNLEKIGVYSPIISFNQIDLGREPGRVNLNTISSDAVWDAVVKGPLSNSTSIPSRASAQFIVPAATGGQTPIPTPTPQPGQNKSAKPAEQLLTLLALDSTATTPFQDKPADISDVTENPLHQMYTATRLANTATNRSHLFAVWITLRTMEEFPNPPAGQVARDPDSVRYHRMFFIYDRSRPVAYESGKDHNVRDGMLVRRVLP